ncbi:MAG: hypothetical protein H5T68_08350 [Chloroflexi bacterium]|nr:hypothetical protein [Chloroflexota bacterium]
MRRELYGYYVTRGLLILAWLGLMILLKAHWEIVLFGVVFMIVLYLWLPHSGRYVIRTDKPLSPLASDERERMVSLQAAAYAFAILVILLAAVVIWSGLRGQGMISIELVSTIMAIGLITQFIASLWLHRKT